MSLPQKTLRAPVKGKLSIQLIHQIAERIKYRHLLNTITSTAHQHKVLCSSKTSKTRLNMAYDNVISNTSNTPESRCNTVHHNINSGITLDTWIPKFSSATKDKLVIT